MTEKLPEYRHYYAQLLMQKLSLTDDEALRQAFQTVPREAFLGRGPWMVADLQGGYVESPTDNPSFVYQDILFALIPEKGINNGSPSLHANNIANLNISRGESITHIGAGTGYYTAILAELTGANGVVTAYEYEPSLVEIGREPLKHWPQISIHQGSVFDTPLPLSDVIYVNAGTPQVETAWVHQLSDGGRLLFPLICSNGHGVMLMVLRRGNDYYASVTSRCHFIGCIGAHNEQASKNLEAMFRAAKADTITRLYLSAPARGQTALLSGDDWYLC